MCVCTYLIKVLNAHFWIVVPITGDIENSPTTPDDIENDNDNEDDVDYDDDDDDDEGVPNSLFTQLLQHLFCQWSVFQTHVIPNLLPLLVGKPLI